MIVLRFGLYNKPVFEPDSKGSPVHVGFVQCVGGIVVDTGPTPEFANSNNSKV